MWTVRLLIAIVRNFSRTKRNYSSDTNFDQSEHYQKRLGSSQEGGLIYVQSLNRSQFSLLILFTDVIFSARFRNHMTFWNFNFVLTTAFILLTLLNFRFSSCLVTSSPTWVCWGSVFIILKFFQSIMNQSRDDSFERLLNQFSPLSRPWFSSDWSRQRVRSGAVRPKRKTSAQRGEVL